MRSNYLKATPVLALAILLLGAGVSWAQSVNLTAGSATAIMPDGQVVPMWGYSCTGAVAPATCAASNPNAGAGGWSPVVITVPPGNLTINLTNNLPVPPGATTGIPTSLTIVGQLGGGLGAAPTRAPSPTHAQQVATWPIAGGNPPAAGDPTFTPPPQGDRVQSFGTEVPTTGTLTPTALTWTGLKPGTYLIESGTHPSIQGPMGLYGVLVVTTPPAGILPGIAYPAPATVTYNADVPLLLSEIDAVQNSAVNFAVGTQGFSETAVWSGQPGSCGDATSATYRTCYPPAVNYDPRYYLVNGVAFDGTGTNATRSLFGATPAIAAGTVLVRFVNAGLRMHVPSIVGAQTNDSSSGTLKVVSGFSLIAEDGNVLPGNPKVQSEVFLAAGKTYDVMINAPMPVAPATAPLALPVFDRQLSLSTNNQRDGGMRAYIGVNGATAPSIGLNAHANNDQYYLVPSSTPGTASTLTVSDPAKGVIANDIGVYGVTVLTPPAAGILSLNPDGTFKFVPSSGVSSGSFSYCANGTVTGSTCSSGLTATVALSACDGTSGCSLGGAPTANPDGYTSTIASRLQISPPGVLANDTDPEGHPLTVDTTSVVPGAGVTITVNADGSFTATTTAVGTHTFTYRAKNSQGKLSGPATVTLTFPAPSGLVVHVYDAPSFQKGSPIAINDYRWIIEEDRTFQINPANPAQNASLGTSFHTSYMPVVAAGCVGSAACEFGQTLLSQPAVCDVGNGACRTSASQQTQVDPSQVHLDPTKHYYISILPGDAGNSFGGGGGAPVPVDPNNPNGPQRQFDLSKDCDFTVGSGNCGHGMGGAPIAPAQTSVNVLVQETPFPTAKIAVFVFEDDSPLNGEVDVHGGPNDGGTAAPAEPGLGGFEITLFDDAGGTGDPTGQMTYDMFNMPLSNSLAGTKDQLTGLDACPISPKSTDGLVGMIATCPHFESDGKTISPLEGQVVVANMMPGRYGVVATPAADRIGRGEQWLQTNTLDGQKAHDSFIKVGGPAYFQEFGPAGYHVAIGFANPAIINARKAGVCAHTTCTSSVAGKVTTARISRAPDQRIYSSSTGDALGFTQCYVSLGDPDESDFAFTKCNSDGTFSLTGLPAGNWRVTVFDQWNDQIVDGLSTPVGLTAGQSAHMEIPVQHWHTNIYTQTYFDLNGNGIRDSNEPGLTLLPTNIRFRDGSYSNFNNTDLSGNAGFNEIFPLFNWYVVEADTTRYKQTGVHVMYDAGGPADGAGGGSSNSAQYFANTTESFRVPDNLRVPGAVYCSDADCTADNRINNPNGGGPGGTTGRIDPPWVTSEGWQGFSGQSSFVEFGKAPFLPGENGGIKGEVIYASTRPFDDPALLIHTSWTPDVPGVTINLYQEGTAADGTQTLTLVDHTKTTSWDDWAQGFHLGPDGAGGTTMIPNMNCPGQGTGSSDLFFFTLQDSNQWLNPTTPLPNHSQYKCYDGMHNFNQLQPAPYDGMYKFPSVTATNPTTGKPNGTNCTICVPNPTPGDGTPMLPAGKYVVEMIVPPGYELVKEEDKNILIGDNYIAPVTQQFGGLASIFILPDQAAVGSTYNPNNPQNPTQDLGATPRHEGDTGSVESFWPCVGQLRVVPDYISLFPQSQEVSPFAGASRHLCDRKEVTLEDQTAALAKFWVFSSTHVAAHFTGFILDDFSSEFDPFSPQFGEKFAVPNLPVSIKDFSGAEISRVYSDQWGQYNGLTYSTWEVNPPNPTGYGPTMMVTCMNDPGSGPTPDPLYNPAYSQFCYENPYMPGQTQYMDTPVVPTAAFAEGYNPADCAYPDATPAISTVTGDTSNGGAGPWVSAPGHTLIINALAPSGTPGMQVLNHAYSGPSATAAPFNQKFLVRHYGFGASQGSGSVTIGGVNAPVTSWSDAQIQVTVPSLTGAQSSCTIQQLGVSTPTQCGELVITSGNGKKSIDTVTVTIGGKPPVYVNGENASNNAIQTAIDSATPGDLIMVGPGTYNEMLIMWKPVRLQGVGAASVKVNANTHPSGKIDTWRRQVACLFGLSLNGGLIGAQNPFDPNGNFTCAPTMRRQVDPIPLEPILGWDPSLNGNIAEMLQEPTLMGAYEGAGITVLAKGVQDVNGQPDPNCVNGDCTVLTASPSDCNNYPSNFLCNPSRVDGMTFTNSSGGGGAIFLHGWNHFMEVSNNRVYANAGTLSGGITVGQVETPDGTIVGTQELAFGYNRNVQLHHNSVTQNASYGDELNSTTPMAAGGVTVCTGSDSYRFNFNWICGNLSAGDGAGFVQHGFSYNGTISNNWVLFNQSTNPTIPTHGGGIAILGAAPDGTFCNNNPVDQDCPPALSDGTGPGLVIDSNLILGNTAESGSGGGLRLQQINGSEVARNATNPGNWYGVLVTNNIIANNVAGWDGGGVSLQDALRVDFINNTVASNDTTASAGVLFNALGSANANTPPPGCTPQPDPTQPQNASCVYQLAPSNPQAAGLVTMPHTSNLAASLPATVTCPAGHFSGPNANNANCRQISYPLLENDMFWGNRSFNIQVGGLGSGNQSQQNLVTLVPTLNQASTGDCPSGATYWDIGVRGDMNAASHDSGFTLAPSNSILTSFNGGYSGNGNLAPSSTPVISRYCNGSRVPPENGGMGYTVPAGISDATLPNPLFSLTAAATVDEGNNWVNMSYGPLSLFSPSNTQLGNYAIASGSPAINSASATGAPNHDFFGSMRPQGAGFDIGAVEFVGTLAAAPTVSLISPTSGTTAGGTGISITGTGFVAGATVNLGGTAATNVNVVSSTSITAMAPAHAAGAVNVVVTNPDSQNGTLPNGYTYTVPNPAPTVSSISPTSGTTAGGTGISITGTGFVAGATVNLGGTAATNVNVVSSTSITAMAPAHAAGAVNVVVTNPDSQNGTLPNGYTYTVPNPAPTVSSISPTSGTTAGGTGISITGTGFVAGATVNLGGTAATNVNVVSSTSITAMAPAHAAGAVNVVVTNPDSQNGTLPNGYTYTSSTGGGKISFVQVKAATPQTATTSVSVTYPVAQTAGDLNIVAVGRNDTTSTVSGVSDSKGNTYTLAIGPTSGTGLRQSIYYAKNIAGGSNTVTVTFNQAAAFVDVRILEYSGLDTVSPLDKVAGAAGTGTSANSGAATTTTANELIFGAGMTSRATTGAGAGFISRIITTPDSDIAEDKIVNATGSYSAAATVTSSNWVMQMATFRGSGQGGAPAPTVATISPSSGTIAGGTPVSITGTGFVAGATVKLGGTAATNVNVVGSTSITATTAAHAAGGVNVVVTNSDTQSGTLTQGFTYTTPSNPAPTVTAISPSLGSVSGGTAVTITGTGFLSGATVSLGGTAASSVTVVNGTAITATTPAHAAGAVNVVVTNTDSQNGTLPNGYTYTVPNPAPTVSSISPTSGTTAGGTGISITGTGFVAGATVNLGGTAATNVNVVSSTSITAMAPAHAAGAVNVVVTNPDSQNGTLPNGYTYTVPNPAPTVSSISPTSGTTAGGTGISITGTGFVAGATVNLGGTAATNVNVVSSTSITAMAPAHAAGAVNVVVTNPDSQNGTLPNGYTYTSSTGGGKISFVQVKAATPQTATTSVSVTYPVAQTAGDLNIVAVGRNDTTSTVSGVSDSKGNTYTLAIGPTSGTGLRQSIYYAKNIAGGSNTVTVTFNQAAAFVDVRILEYSGLDTVSPLDKVAGAAGTGTSANSGAATTTTANELIFGAGMTSRATTGAGAGFISRIITTPDSDIAEDKIVNATGSYSAAATVTSSNWVMQMATFK